jgi:hypothetical protein
MPTWATEAGLVGLPGVLRRAPRTRTFGAWYWSRPGRLDEVLLPYLARWRFERFDVPGLMRRTPIFYEYLMCDRDALEPA